MTYTLNLSYLPCSLNRLMRMSWVVRRKILFNEASEVRIAAFQQDIPRATGKRRVSVVLVLGPHNRQRDGDNCLKSLLDALVKAGLLVDDSPQWCDWMPPVFERGPKAATRVMLEDVE